MANIVISIHNPLLKIGGRYPYFENLINNLAKYGNNILLFESQKYTKNYDKIPKDILKKVKDFNPNLFIFMNNNFWNISEYFKDIPIVIYDVDSPNVYSDIEVLKANKERYKYFTITSSGSNLIQEAIGVKKDNICYIVPFTGVMADKTIEPSINIGFCGSHWLWNDIQQFYDFISKNPTDKERNIAKIVYEKYKERPNKTFEELYFGYNVKNALKADNLYIFSTRISGIERLRYLTEIADLGLEVRGNCWDIWQPLLSVFPEVLLSYSYKPVNNLVTTQDFYNRCKIAFNTNHIQAKNGFSWRVADILASNACLVTQDCRDLNLLGFNLPMYKSKAEARELCQKLLSNDSLRKELIEHSQEIINKNHRFENVLPVMEEFLNMDLHNSDMTGSIEIFNIDKFNNLKLKNKLRYKVLNFLNDKKKLSNIEYRVLNHYVKILRRNGVIINSQKCKEFETIRINKRHEKYLEKVNELQSKTKHNKKFKVAFLVIFDSVFPGEKLFEQMLQDEIFEPYIVVIPDISRGDENKISQMDKTYKTLSEKYPNCVYKSWDDKRQKFIDFSRKMDMFCSANPYDSMTHKFYRIGKLARKNILPIYFNYGYPAVTFARRVASLDSLSFAWKVFSESKEIIQQYSEVMLSKGENLVLAGYMKMDTLFEQKKQARTRKKIIIAPHHTIEVMFKSSIGLSNFLQYANFFKELPKLYPQIDFVFRPHPLLKVTLEKETIWGKEETEKYFKEIQENQNLIYQEGGEYFETFANSDGIIHDCSSFLAEYMFTKKPGCYMLANQASIDNYFMENGKEILKHYYQAFQKEDIINYIDNVILGGIDPKKEKREEFTEKELMVNYPNVSKFVIDYIKKELV